MSTFNQLIKRLKDYLYNLKKSYSTSSAVMGAVLLDRAKYLIDVLFHSVICYILLFNWITFSNILNAWGMPQELQGGRNGIDHNPICSLGVPQSVPEPFYSYLAGLAFIMYLILIGRLVAPRVNIFSDGFSLLIYRLKSVIHIYFGGHLFLISCLFFNNTSIMAVMSFKLNDGSFHLKPVKLVSPAEYFHWVPPERLPFVSLIPLFFLLAFLLYLYTKNKKGREKKDDPKGPGGNSRAPITRSPPPHPCRDRTDKPED